MKFATKALFVLIFTALVLVSSQINFSALMGGTPNQFFTFFQFLGPIGGLFLGPIFGAASVLLAQILEIAVTGKSFDVISILRLLPMVMAAVYFALAKDKNGNWMLLVPILATIAFVMHPVGAQVWYYAVIFWSIPIIAKLFFSKNLFARSLGTTFTAHSVGGAIWIYAFNTTPELWNFLLFSGTVLFERVLFALGICISFIVMNTLLTYVENKLPEGVITLEKQYDLRKMLSWAK